MTEIPSDKIWCPVTNKFRRVSAKLNARFRWSAIGRSAIRDKTDAVYTFTWKVILAKMVHETSWDQISKFPLPQITGDGKFARPLPSRLFLYENLI